jgi:hypothetical protein
VKCRAEVPLDGGHFIKFKLKIITLKINVLKKYFEL